MLGRAVILLLYLPVCCSSLQDYAYHDPDERDDEPYDQYDGEVVTMPALATTTMSRRHMGIDINKLLISPDPMWPGFRYWPLNGTLPSLTLSTDEESRPMSEPMTKTESTATHTRVRRQHGQWSPVMIVTAEMDGADYSVGTTSTIGTTGTIGTISTDGTTGTVGTVYKDNLKKILRQKDEEGENIKPTKKPTTTTWGTFAEGARTYWAYNRPHTYPRSIFVNGTWHMLPPDWPFNTEVIHTCPTLPPTTTTPTTVKPTIRLDIQGLLDIIANLTYEYDMNLTEKFNETLVKYSVPTCPVPTTTVTPSPTTPVYDFANTTIVGKCFVCGLDKEQIPKDAYCADAFAGDFLPLVPIDPRARGQIARYRKYCRYLDVRHYELNAEEPRAVYGRFTGGCSVRWTDLTGVYTQRTCRNKRRAVMGKHFASKRMAKLEMALSHLDNGCIVSPMATLLPLSRGVSLYARFHACVCTGAWCNRSVQNEPWMMNFLLPVWLYASR